MSVFTAYIIGGITILVCFLTGNDEEIIQDSKRQKTTISSKNASHIYRDEKRLKRMAEELNDATLLKVQLNLLNIIGSFAHLLELGTENEENHKNNKVMSAGKTFLKYAIPFSDMRPDIYFGKRTATIVS